MLFSYFRSHEKESLKLLDKIANTPDHIHDLLIERYFKEHSHMPPVLNNVVEDLSVIYYHLMNTPRKMTFLYTNPFSGKYIRISTDPFHVDGENKSSYMLICEDSIIKKDYFNAFEIVMKKVNMLQEHTFDTDFESFQSAIYHEMAHAHFLNYLGGDRHYKEASADLASVIYFIKKNNVSLEEAKKHIDNVIRIRLSTAYMFSYVRDLCVKPRIHATEQVLILFRNINLAQLTFLQQLPDTDILRFVLYWLDSMKRLLKNIYHVDFNNKSLVKFLFYNTFNEKLLKTDSMTRFYLRIKHAPTNQHKRLIEKRHQQLELSGDETNLMTEFYLLNVSNNLGIFNDFMTTHLLHSNFDYTVKSLFNQDDYQYAFLDVIKKIEQYDIIKKQKYNYIPFNYNMKDLNNFMMNSNCKI